MTKDELIVLMDMYLTVSDNYINNYPSDDTWLEAVNVSEVIIESWKSEGKLEILKELINKEKEQNEKQ